MLFSKRKVNGQHQIEDANVSQDLTRAAQFLSTVGRLTSHLESNSKGGRSLDDTLNTWHRWQIDSMWRQFSDVIDAEFSWWMYFRNPIWTCIFNLKRRQLLNEPGEVRSENLERLDYCLGRAEFVFSLSSASRNFMRKQIADGVLSPWRAMSLMRSFGCKISKSGAISPAPIGRIGVAIGMTTALSMIATLILVVVALLGELSSPCVRVCVVSGSIQMIASTAYFAVLALSLTNGRNRDARLLSMLQRPSNQHSAAIGQL